MRRPAAAIVLRWLPFAADSVADGSHLAIMSVQVTRPPFLDVNRPYRHSKFGCDLDAWRRASNNFGGPSQGEQFRSTKGSLATNDQCFSFWATRISRISGRARMFFGLLGRPLTETVSITFPIVAGNSSSSLESQLDSDEDVIGLLPRGSESPANVRLKVFWEFFKRENLRIVGDAGLSHISADLRILPLCPSSANEPGSFEHPVGLLASTACRCSACRRAMHFQA